MALALVSILAQQMASVSRDCRVPGRLSLSGLWVRYSGVIPEYRLVKRVVWL
jgi:hypothetical protein